MIVNKYANGGGGSGSGVTPQDVQRQIDRALTPYWESGETKSYVDEAVSGISLDGYWTSAQTESAITEAVAGKADAKIMVDFDHTPQSERAALYATLKGLYDGGSGATINKNYDFYKTVNTWQGLKIDYYGFSGDTMVFGKVVSPENTADQVVYEQVLTIDSLGNIAVVTNTVGGGADMSEYYTSAQTEEAITSKNYVNSGQVETQITDKNYITSQALTSYTPTSGFSTINGSAITAGGNIEIQGGSADLSGYWTSAQTEEKIASAVTPVAEHLAEVEQVTSSGYNELHTQVLELSARTAPDLSAYYTSAQTEEAITSKNYVVSGQVKSQVEAYNYVTSAETEAQILSKNYTTSAETKVYVDSAVTGVQDQIDTMDEVIAEALVDLDGRVDAISAATPDLSPYWTSAQTENALSSALIPYYTSAQTDTAISAALIPYYTSAQTDDAISSALIPYYTSAQTDTAISAATQNMVVSTDVRQIVKLTQAAYDQLATKDPYTFYIIVNSN